MQVLAMEHAARADATLPIARPRRTIDGRPTGAVAIAGVDHAVQLVTFIDGAAFPPGPPTPERAQDPPAARLLRGARRTRRDSNRRNTPDSGEMITR
jgi:hypothetical protein